MKPINMKPIRVLHVFSTLDRGGAETMIMNIYRKIDRNIVQFDFVVNENKYKYDYEDEITSLGGRVYRMPRYFVYNFFAYKRAWKKLLNEHPEWYIIHGHLITSAFIYFDVARALKRKVIAHSHTAGDDKSFKAYARLFFYYLMRRKLMGNKAAILFACSNSAAQYVFGNDLTSDSPLVFDKNSEFNKCRLHIIKNAIDVDRYVYNSKIREVKRKELDIQNKFLDIQNKFVIGHIGMFRPEKNHSFIIDVFFQIKKSHQDSVLILVGDGQLRDEISQKVKSLDLNDSVIFTGVRSDVSDLMQAMDIFILPSLYEGLPVTVIEAQAAGLPSVISDVVTDEAKITELVNFLPLDISSDESVITSSETSAEHWAKKILDYNKTYSRMDTKEEIKTAGYDIDDAVKKITDIYVSIMKVGIE